MGAPPEKLGLQEIYIVVSSWKTRVGFSGASGKVAAMIDLATDGAESPTPLTAMTLN